MKRPALGLVMVAALTLHSLGAEELSAEHRLTVEVAEKFHPISRTADLPPAVLEVVAARDGKIAEPSGAWNATDAISDPSLPAKRLIWAASDGRYFIVHYERGGIAHTHHITIAKISPNESKSEFIWTVRTEPLADYAAFVAALRTNKLDADARHAR